MARARTREPDPPTQLRGLRQALRAEGLPRAALLKGEEHYFIDRALEELGSAAAAQGLEICRHDAGDPEFVLPALLDDLGAQPLFASARCVVVRGADPLLKKDGSKASVLTRTALAFLESDRTGSLVICGKSIRADHALAKAIRSAGGPLFSSRKLWDSPPPWDPDPRKSELAQWVSARATELGLRLSADDAAYLAAATGNDLAAIDTQLEKVRRGGRESLRELVGWNSGGTPWKASDELLGGDVGRGIAALEALFRAGFHSSRDGRTEVNPAALSAILLASLRSKARQGLAGARALGAGASPVEAAEAAGVSAQPNARAQFQSLVTVRGPRRWLSVYRDVLVLERKSRTGAALDVNDFYSLAMRWRAKGRDAATARGRR